MNHSASPPSRPVLPALLLVDDDSLIVDTLSIVLGQDFEVYPAGSREDAVALLRDLPEPPPLALVDLGLPPRPHEPDEGYRLISALLSHSPAMKVLVLSGQSEDAAGRHARSLGATEFIPKPANPARLKKLLLDALNAKSAEREAEFERSNQKFDPLDALIGTSPPMHALKVQLRQYAESPFPVLIEGESGSGKEVAASALHAVGTRRTKPYFALNCAAIAPTLVEPTLFGYAKGAFTGATSAKAGYFEDAQDGTLFLDEIGELPLELQAKLLRVLENGEYNRVGETQSRKSNARIIAATNRDLRAESKRGGFRADLYHRLSVFTVRVPALKDLGDDKSLLLHHFRGLYAQSAKVAEFRFDEEAARLWLDYPFPGNVRELRNVVIRLVTKFPGMEVPAAGLEPELDSGALLLSESTADGESIEETALRELARRGNFDLDARLSAWEHAYIASALKHANGNVSQAARLLGLNRTTLYSRMAALEARAAR